jgi:hypothetical protein
MIELHDPKWLDALRAPFGSRPADQGSCDLPQWCYRVIPA